MHVSYDGDGRGKVASRGGFLADEEHNLTCLGQKFLVVVGNDVDWVLIFHVYLVVGLKSWEISLKVLIFALFVRIPCIAVGCGNGTRYL